MAQVLSSLSEHPLLLALAGSLVVVIVAARILLPVLGRKIFGNLNQLS